MKALPLSALLISALFAASVSPVHSDELMDLINAIEPITPINESSPQTSDAAPVEPNGLSTYNNWVDNPDATMVREVVIEDGVASQDLDSASLDGGVSSDLQATDIYRDGGRFRTTGAGDYLLPCTNCTDPDSVGMLAAQVGDGDEVLFIEVTQEEALAVVSLETMGGATGTRELNDLMAESTVSERFKAGALAGAVIRDAGGDELVVDNARDRITQSYSPSIDGERSGISQLEADYLSALTTGNREIITEQRSALVASVAEDLIASGVSPEAAYAEAVEYVSGAFDSSEQMSSVVQNEWDEAGVSTPPIPQLGSAAINALNTDLSNAPEFSTTPIALNPPSVNVSPTFVSDVELANSLSTLINVGDDRAAISAPTFNAGIVIDPSMTGGVVPSSPQSFNSGSGRSGGLGELFPWATEIRLYTTDMFYITLKRMLGGPVESLYTALVDPSTGKFRPTYVGLPSNPKEPTATTMVITSVIFVVLVMAGLMISFIVLYGLYRTGRDGELFGKDWDSFWVPTRAIASGAAIIPIPQLGGMNGAMALILTIVLFSTGIASTIGTIGFKWLTSRPIIEPVAVQSEGFVSAIAKAHACMSIRKSHDLMDEDDGFYHRTLLPDGNVQDSNFPEPEEPSGPDGLLDQVVVWLGFASGHQDIIRTGSDQERAIAIGKAYKEAGQNPYSFALREYRYGRLGECGMSYTPVPLRAIGANDLEPHNDVVRHATKTIGTIFFGNEGNEAEAREEAASLFDASEADLSDLYGTAEQDSSRWLNTMRQERYAYIEARFDTLNTQVGDAVNAYISSVTDNPDTHFLAMGNLAAALTTSQDNFYSGLTNDLTKAMASIDDPSMAATQDYVARLGWFALGSVYWLIEHRQTMIMSIFDYSDLAPPTPAAVSRGDDIEAFSNDIHLKRINETIDSAVGPTGVRYVSQSLQKVASGAPVDTGSIGQSISDVVTAMVLEPAFAADINNFNISPIERVRHLGVSLTNGYLAAQATLAVLSAGSKSVVDISKVSSSGNPILGKIAGVASFIGSMAASLATALSGLAGPLLSGAFICANILPAMPYIMLLVAAMGYAIYVVEALVGINFWFVNIGRPDGHDVWGQGGQGWGTLLTLALRPLLIVIGFFIGISFNWVFGHWINATLLPTMMLQNSDGAGTLFGNLSQFGGVIVVFSGLHLFSAWKGFSLSWELPNAIFRWLGVQDHQDLGEREAKENALAVAVPVGGGAAQGMASQAKQLGAKLNKGKDGGGDKEKDDKGGKGDKGDAPASASGKSGRTD